MVCTMACVPLERLMLHALELLRITEVGLEVRPRFVHRWLGVPFLTFEEVDAGLEHLIVCDVQDGGA